MDTNGFDLNSILKKNKLFEGLTEREAEGLVGDFAGNVREFRQGDPIYSPGKYHKALGLVLTGTIVVTRKGDPGVQLNTLTEGAIFGAAALFGEQAEQARGGSQEYATEIRARTNASVWFIPGEAVRELVRTNPGFAENYIRFLSEKVRFLNKRIADFTAAGTERKLAGYLASCPAGEDNIIKPNRSALARSLDIGRASLYRVLDGLEAKGLIRRSEKGIEIIDRDGLRKLSAPA